MAKKLLCDICGQEMLSCGFFNYKTYRVNCKTFHDHTPIDKKYLDICDDCWNKLENQIIEQIDDLKIEGRVNNGINR